jgi:hypothetical protein
MAEKKKRKKVAKEKPLDKMTAKDLRELALQTGSAAGVHAMNKAELIAAIKQARGVVEDKAKAGQNIVREIKAKIRKLKTERVQAVADGLQSRVAILRRKISRLKKKTRNAA